MPSPTIIEQSSAAATEAAKAKFWRKNVARLSRGELGRRIGYSVAAISLFEQGYDANGRPLGTRAWTRYRMVCAGLGSAFNWGVTNGEEAKPVVAQGGTCDARDEARTTPQRQQNGAESQIP